MKQQTVCFVIHGPDLVRIARERLLEDDPGHAWRIASCLNGDGSEGAAIAILKGEKTLIGDSSSGMDLVDEDPAVRAEHEKQVAWLYAGRIRRSGAWWQPIAEVHDYGPMDVAGRRACEGRHGTPHRGDYGRAWHYADADEIVFPEAMGEDERAVIWRRCGELPQWMTPPLTPRDALAQFRAAGRALDVRSHSRAYGTSGWPADPGPPERTGTASTTIVDDAIDEGEAAFDALVDMTLAIDRDKRDAELEAKYAEEDRVRAEKLVAWRAKILEQAGGDVFTLSWDANGTAEAGSAVVPRVPFMRWCLNRYRRLRHLMPAWTNVCPWGLKMQGDDPDHSDWMVGAGLDVDYQYHCHPSYSAAVNKMSEIVGELQEKQAAGVVMLSSGPIVTGPIVHGKRGEAAPAGAVVVLPDLRPSWLPVIEHAAAVITEEGGATAHLANVGRERSLPIIRWPGALKIWHRDGDFVTVDVENHSVEDVREDPYDDQDDDGI